MLSLSPAKLLVILVIALIVLGPDKLPQVARQIGAAWHDMRQWRSRIESEVRGTFPNLPPTHEVAQAVRSPLAFLDRLADEHERALTDEPTATPEVARPDAAGPGPPADGTPVSGTPVSDTPVSGNGSVPTNGSAPHTVSEANTGSAASGPEVSGATHNGSVGHNGTGAGVSPPGAAAERAGTGVPSMFPAVPDDPSMN